MDTGAPLLNRARPPANRVRLLVIGPTATWRWPMAAALLAANSSVSALPTDKAYWLQIKLVNGANKTNGSLPTLSTRTSRQTDPHAGLQAQAEHAEKLSLEEQDHSQVQGALR